jgi:TatD DNase family protein
MMSHNITHAIQIGCDRETTQKALKLAQDYPEYFRATVGFHPENAQNYTLDSAKKELDTLEILIRDNREMIVAIGECGLDYHYLTENREHEIMIQRFAWKYQAEIGKKYNLPLVIHSRDAREDTLLFMQENEIWFAIMHCYAEDYPFACELMKLSPDIYFSFSWVVTYKSAPLIQEAAAKIPLDRILIETDAPFLSPQPVRGTVNEPANTRYVLEKICELRTEPREVIEKIIYENSKRVYGI